MKNKLLLAIVFLFGIFFPFTSVEALTKINFIEKGNGQIDTTLHFEEGFVGAIDVTFNVSGNVYVKDFQFSDKISSNNYGKEYKYNKDKHTLTVRVTTGGTGTSHNLLNSKKELVLGTINFASSAKDDVKYKLSETTFKIVDNNWKSKTIAQSHITLGDTQFTYKVNKTEEEKPNTPGSSDQETDKPSDNPSDKDDNNPDISEDDKENDNNQEDDDKNDSSKDDNKESESSSKNNSTSSNKNTTNKNSKTNSSNSNTKTTTEESNTDTSVDEDEDETAIEPRSVGESETTKKEAKEESKFNWTIVISVLAIIAACGGAYFFITRKDKK